MENETMRMRVSGREREKEKERMCVGESRRK